MRLTLILAAALLAASNTSAATIRDGGVRVQGERIALNVADFARVGQTGSGRSITAGHGNPYEKGPGDRRPYGRFDPFGVSWIDSGDGDRTVWTVRHDKAFTRLTFALTDAFDQKRDDRYGGKSYFRLKAAGATWSIDKREKNGTLHWITILLDDPVKRLKVRFITRVNDGWGVIAPSVEPIPLPAAGWMLLAGAAALVGLRSARGVSDLTAARKGRCNGTVEL